MTRRQFARLMAAALAAARGAPLLRAQEDDAMLRYVGRIRADLARLRTEHLGAITQAGERLAERVAAGGRLLIYDLRGGYSAEAVGRAGGLMAIHSVRPGQEASIPSADALLIVADEPAHETDLAMARAARDAGALVVGICPVRAGEGALSSLCDAALDDLVTDADAAITIPGLDAPIAPTSGVMNTVILWAVTAAYIEAMERRGKPPQVWMSIKRPGAQESNARAMATAKEVGY